MSGIGHAGLILGSADISRLDQVIRGALARLASAARANAKGKQETHKKFPQLGSTLTEWSFGRYSRDHGGCSCTL